MGIKIEICVTNAESAIKAQKAGAGRIELCGNLLQGGITPGISAVEVIRKNLGIDMNVMVRPREGDFLYSDIDFDIMLRDIRYFKKAGADGIVTGILKKDGSVDTGRCRELVKISKPMSATFHRAFDMTPDPYDALEKIIDCGFDRILTSGGKKSAWDGRKLIKELVQKAGNRIIIMPGAGINDKNAVDIIDYTGAKEIHLSAKNFADSKMRFQNRYLLSKHSNIINEYRNQTVDEKIIRKIRKFTENY
ncbi:MAG: copper homeostasis protein CutC [Ignavibacteria bacterium]|jgi:copper homeostasis protein|nr:copper homeostasis protein CutC [Ignavibacteria bacterium]